MKRFILLLLILFIPSLFFGQDSTAIQFGQTITANDLRTYLSILASDSLEGRETGERGQKMAAEYIKEQFKRFKLRPVVPDADGFGYYQKFNLRKTGWGEVYIKLNGVKKENFKDLLYLSNISVMEEVQTKLVFVGEGRKGDFDNLDIRGKAVAFFSKEFRNWKEEISHAQKRGASAIFVIFNRNQKEFNKTINRYGHYLSKSKLTLYSNASNNGKELPVYFISPELAANIFNVPLPKMKDIIAENKRSRKNKLKKIKQVKVSYKAERKTEKVSTENVLGLIEGSTSKEEVIIITAHYDHIGKHNGLIYNGADDDGSGTSAVIEIAEAFANASQNGFQPKRSVLFMTVTGEEKGLLGSKYYVTNPVFPLENTVANLNIDMIGRLDDYHKEDPDYVYLIGSDKLSSELHDLSEKINDNYTGLDLDYTYNDEDDPNRYYYRSDHYNFAKNNIPVIFYFNGVHADYHQATDTIDKINFKKMTKITRLIFYTAWELANRSNRIKLDER